MNEFFTGYGRSGFGRGFGGRFSRGFGGRFSRGYDGWSGGLGWGWNDWGWPWNGGYPWSWRGFAEYPEVWGSGPWSYDWPFDPNYGYLPVQPAWWF